VAGTFALPKFIEIGFLVFDTNLGIGFGFFASLGFTTNGSMNSVFTIVWIFVAIASK
jgi:hypothetical protein